MSWTPFLPYFTPMLSLIVCNPLSFLHIMVAFCLNLIFPIKEVKELGGDTRWSGREEKQTDGARPSRDMRQELGGQSYRSPAPMTRPQPHQSSNGPHVSRPPPAYSSPARTFQSIEDAYFNPELKSTRPAPYRADLAETIGPTPRLHNEPEMDTDAESPQHEWLDKIFGRFRVKFPLLWKTKSKGTETYRAP